MLYVMSLLFLLGAAGAIVLGVRGPSLFLVYGSVTCSVLSMLFLAADVSRRRRIEPDAEPVRSDWTAWPSATGPPVAHDLPEASPLGAGEGTRVIAVAERHTFHRPGCHHVQGRTDGVEEMDLGEAERRGYTACGLCKPA